MAQLVPSILETSKEAFLHTYSQEVKLPGVSRIQVDFGDGIFVPNKMLPVEEIDLLNPAISWEAHLMIKSPRDFLDYQICGFKTIIVHYEAYPNEAELKEAILKIKSMGLEPAVAIKNETPIQVLASLVGNIQHIQIMSVKPGFQGSAFMEDTYERIAAARQLLPHAVIEVDGGINLDNAKKVAAAGADYLILGAAITKAPSMSEAFEKIQSELNKN